MDSVEFVARVLLHIPDLNKPYIHYYGIYSNRSQHKPRKVSKILRHLRNRKETSRAPPTQHTEPVFAST
jgi:hypothetical protein